MKQKIDLSLFRDMASRLPLQDLRALQRSISLEITKKTRAAGSKREIPVGEYRAEKSYNKSLSMLLSEDWSGLFAGVTNSDPTFCVYMHGHPRNLVWRFDCLGCLAFKEPFYVGMGSEDRPYNFNRGQHHSSRLQKLQNAGFSKHEIACVVAKGLTERQARELESKLILFYGIKGSILGSNRKPEIFTGMKPSLINSQYEPMPPNWLSFR